MKTCALERDSAAASSWGLRPHQCFGESFWGPLSGQRLCFVIDMPEDMDSDPGGKTPMDKAFLGPDCTPQPHTQPGRCNRRSHYLCSTFTEPWEVTLDPPRPPHPSDMGELQPI